MQIVVICKYPLWKDSHHSWTYLSPHMFIFFLYKKGGVFFFFPALNSQPVVKEIIGSEGGFYKIMQYFLQGWVLSKSPRILLQSRAKQPHCQFFLF